MANAEEGTRNDTLNRAAFALGQLVGGGELPESQTHAALVEAGRRAGLGTVEASRTTDSGLYAGMQEPRKAPAPANPEDATEAALDAAATFALEVEREAYRQRVRDAAREKVARETAGEVELPPLARLDEFLSVPDEDVTHRVETLWPTGGRVVLSAPHKSGKTTLTGNLVRSLADGEPFLGRFGVERATRVVLVDNELDERMLRRWLRDHDVANQTAVELLALRGRLSAFAILDPETRKRWAEHIGPADVLVLDCLRPALDALGLDENREAGRFLEALDELAAAAGISEVLVVHHMGHNGERSRGDSRILDWPDAVWKLVRDAEDDADDEVVTPARRVYFSGYGRDVDQPETLLAFDPASRRLSVAGGTRRETRIAPTLEAVLELLDGTAEPLSGRQVEDALTGDGQHGRQPVRDALKLARRRGDVLTEKGPKNATLHSLNPSVRQVRRSAPSALARSESECASAPIERRTHTHTAATPDEVEEAAHS